MIFVDSKMAVRVGALVALLGSLLAPVAAAPQAQASFNTLSVHVQDKGYLIARGAGAALKVVVKCPPKMTASVGLRIAQPPGSEILQWGFSTSFVCDGTLQWVPVGLAANSVPLRVGPATAVPILTVCDAASGCSSKELRAQWMTFTDTFLTQPFSRFGDFSRTSDSMAIKIAPEGVVSDDGRTIVVPVSYRCTNWFSFIRIQYKQLAVNSPDLVETVSLTFDAGCTNTWQTFNVPLTYELSRFHPGRAFVIGSTAAESWWSGMPTVAAFRGVSLTAQ